MMTSRGMVTTKTEYPLVSVNATSSSRRPSTVGMGDGVDADADGDVLIDGGAAEGDAPVDADAEAEALVEADGDEPVDADALAALESGGVRVYPVEAHAIRTGRYPDHVILGYGNLDAERIRTGVERLRAVLEERCI